MTDRNGLPEITEVVVHNGQPHVVVRRDLEAMTMDLCTLEAWSRGDVPVATVTAPLPPLRGRP